MVGEGAAYVFTETRTGSNMTETAKLTPSDSAANNRFGELVSISGDTVVVGAYRCHRGWPRRCQGAAYVYAMPGPLDQHDSDREAHAPLRWRACNYFGTSVSIDGDLVAVADGGGNGVTFLFTESGSRGAKPPSSFRPMADREVLSTAPCRGRRHAAGRGNGRQQQLGSGLPVRAVHGRARADRPVDREGPASGGTAVTITGTNLAGAPYTSAVPSRRYHGHGNHDHGCQPVGDGLVNVTVAHAERNIACHLGRQVASWLHGGDGGDPPRTACWRH